MDTVEHTLKEQDSFKATIRLNANVGDVCIDRSSPVSTFTEEYPISTSPFLCEKRHSVIPLFAYRGNKYVSPVMEDRLKRGLLTSADLDRYLCMMSIYCR